MIDVPSVYITYTNKAKFSLRFEKMQDVYIVYIQNSSKKYSEKILPEELFSTEPKNVLHILHILHKSKKKAGKE